MFEGWIANLLRVHGDYAGLFDDWCYWAPAEATRTEVDFLLRRGREWLAIEAKSTPRIGADELRGLRAVRELRGLTRRILVHTGPRPRRTDDGIDIWPVATFTRALADDSLWP